MTFPLPASLLYGFLTKRFFSLSSGHIAFIYHCFGKLHNITPGHWVLYTEDQASGHTLCFSPTHTLAFCARADHLRQLEGKTEPTLSLYSCHSSGAPVEARAKKKTLS